MTDGFRPEFERFFDAYPEHRRIARENAYIEWRRISVVDMDIPALFGALEAWKASEEWQKEDGKFVPNILNFLRDGRWKHPPKVRPKKESIDELRKRIYG